MEVVHWWILQWTPRAKYSHPTTLILIKNALSILNVMQTKSFHQILLLLVMMLIIHGQQEQATLGFYLHWQHLMWIFGLAKLLLLILVNSSQWLAVLAITSNYIGVIYSLNRMDIILAQYSLHLAQPLDKQHFNMHGRIINIKHQHCNSIGAR